MRLCMQATSGEKMSLLSTVWCWSITETSVIPPSSSLANHGGFSWPICSRENLHLSLSSSSLSYRFHRPPRSRWSIFLQAKNGKSGSEPALKPSIVEEALFDDDEDEIIFEEDDMMDDDEDDDEYFEDEIAETYAGDGADGGGISLAGTSWDKEALILAEKVLLSFEGDLKIYAFRSLPNSTIQVRIEKLSNKSGSPTMSDIEAFSSAYRKRLNEAELTGSIPNDISLEVSSPGVERAVRIPEDLDRFKHRAMHVKYVTIGDDLLKETSYGVFRLISFDVEDKSCTWGLADVRVNREKAGKGRPLNKKQREWQVNTSFDSLLLVRIYSEA
ncbi:uncharacterized protein LOC124945724 isoform X2 [Impatiens glandulifera]|uniref:uncharacterized protein LOC124945724 isoform X2 n=1 Tax=Impatiens glandulifera TaxID=253017 RepID=UPI001FB110EF|nr:uncharacterized protein LOC124945724 isoform X2 [Impatiens glandulifera]